MTKFDIDQYISKLDKRITTKQTKRNKRSDYLDSNVSKQNPILDKIIKDYIEYR